MPRLKASLDRDALVLPERIATAAGIEAGADVFVHVNKLGRIEIQPMPSMSFDEFIARFSVDRPYHDSIVEDAWNEEIDERYGQLLIESRD